MKFGIKTLDDFDVAGKTVLCRIDINEPIDRAKETLKDITRVQACVPTIRELTDKGAKVVLLAHQGSDIEYKNFWTLEPHGRVLSDLLLRPVAFVDDVCGPAARDAIRRLKAGDILLLDNVRFVSEEQTLFEQELKLSHAQQAQTLLVRKLAPLADVYVCDAFAAAHRDQPSLCGFEQVLPSAMGRLFEREFTVVAELMEAPAQPCVFVLGGAKVADAFLMARTVLDRGIADCVLAGGLVGNIMLWAAGNDVGEASRAFIRKQGYEKCLETAKEILRGHHERVVLPEDLARVAAGERQEHEVDALRGDLAYVDIGARTIRRFTRIIGEAKTIFVNGPMGVFEEAASRLGTEEIWSAIAGASGFSVVGGGDSIAATNKYGLADKMGYICTGGGALIRFLTGEELPVVKALRFGSTHKQLFAPIEQ